MRLGLAVVLYVVAAIVTTHVWATVLFVGAGSLLLLSAIFQRSGKDE
jgi:hypothetical protein